MSAGGGWDGRDLTELLTLEPVGERGWRSYVCERNSNGRVFGGQLLGQALWAAARSARGRLPAMLQLAFLKGAEPSQALEYSIDELQDGRRLTTRHVYAVQGTGLVLSANASFQAPPAEAQAGQYWAHPAPAPEGLATLAELAPAWPGYGEAVQARWQARPFVDLRPVAPEGYLAQAPAQPELAHWVRLKPPLGSDGSLHHAALAYLSDIWLHAGMAPTGGLLQLWRDCYISSLNHTLWFHSAQLDANDWLLFSNRWVAGAAGRHLIIAQVYRRDGLRVASAAQELMVTPRAP